MLISLIKSLPAVRKKVSKGLNKLLSWDPWVNYSWSQEGEDQILCRMFENQTFGFYVDVGAHHPKRFSNTYLFYKRGWRGINIDALPGSMRSFSNIRKRDINLELGVGSSEGWLDYYSFDEPALNTFSRQLALTRKNDGKSGNLKEIIKVKVLPLSSVLDQYLPKDQTIDFMSIDVEGLDYEVLRSNDWVKYRPKVVLVEVLGSDILEVDRNEISTLMRSHGYAFFAKSLNTVFFKEM